MQEKLFESEAKVMEIIWARCPISAKEVSLIAAETIGWNKNTTYTVIKKLEGKGFISADFLRFQRRAVRTAFRPDADKRTEQLGCDHHGYLLC